MMIRRSGALVALITALSLAGCAGDTAATNGASDVGAPAASASDTPAAPVPSVPSDQPTTGSRAGKGTPGGKGAPGSTGQPSGTQTITGTVAAGVEPGCLVLNGSSGSHLLIIKDDKARTAAAVGSSVTVVGKAQPDMMTTCQQGTPFLVSEVRAG